MNEAQRDLNELRGLLQLARNGEDTDTRVLAARVAEEFGIRGRESAIAFLRGYYYTTGTTRHSATNRVAAEFGLFVSDLR